MIFCLFNQSSAPGPFAHFVLVKLILKSIFDRIRALSMLYSQNVTLNKGTNNHCNKLAIINQVCVDKYVNLNELI